MGVQRHLVVEPEQLVLAARPHLEDSGSGDVGGGQGRNAKFATGQPATGQYFMQATAQAPDRVSFRHTAILRPLICPVDSRSCEVRIPSRNLRLAVRSPGVDQWPEPVLDLLSSCVSRSRPPLDNYADPVRRVGPLSFLAARLDLARQLHQAGKVKLIVVSGDSTAAEYDEPQAMRSYLIAAGIPESQVIIDNAGIDTYSSCVRARAVFGVSDLIVVTQSYHLPRAVATCLRVGVNAYGVGDDSVRHTRSWRSGALRDQVACVKTVLDLVVDRRPRLD